MHIIGCVRASHIDLWLGRRRVKKPGEKRSGRRAEIRHCAKLLGGPHTHLHGRHADQLVPVVEETGQDVKNGCSRGDDLFKAFRVKGAAVNCRQKDGLNLVVSQLIRG